MNTQTKIEASSLASAYALAFGEIEAAMKSAKNPHFKSKYADITAVIDAIKPALIKHGLFFTQHCHPCERGVQVETHLHHASGETMPLGSLYVPANKQDAQGFGSALTYARRYALVTAFGVPTEDDDGSAAVKAGQGQSQNGAVSPAPATEPASKGWSEPKSEYNCKTALHKGLTVHEAELRRIGDEGVFDDLEAYLTSPEYIEFVRVAGRYSNHYLEGGEPAPPEFVGCFALEQRARDMIALRSNQPAYKEQN